MYPPALPIPLTPEPLRLADVAQGDRVIVKVSGWLERSGSLYRLQLDGGEVITLGPEHLVVEVSGQ